MAHTLRNVLLSEPEQIHLLPIAVSLNWIFFCNETSEPELHQVLKPGIMGFVQAQVLGERNWRTEVKSGGKNMLRNPLHNLLENLLNTWPVLAVFINPILGTKKIKDRRRPTGLGNSYWSPADSGAFGTRWGAASPEFLSCPHWHSPVCGGFEETRNERS